MDDVEVSIEVEVNPTESEEKVKKAIENIFGNITLKIKPLAKGCLLTAEMKGLETLTKFYNLLRRERICDAAHGVFLEGLSGNTITFYLNKQAAYAGHVSFSKAIMESPLGPIKVQIKCDNPRLLIDWLAPRTASEVGN
jgi:predicted RNA binding protein with dsRBD fold (UPF0201 family)